MSRPRRLRPFSAALLPALVLLAGRPATADPAAVAVDFADRLAAALPAGPVAMDSLWAPDARDSLTRDLDLRTAAMFRWDAPRVSPGRAWTFPDGAVGVEVSVAATATWQPDAWGVASALWPLQCDENRETNRVRRREAWRLEDRDGAWLATERIRLRPVEVVDASIDARVFPGQGALLVDASFYVRSRLEGLEAMRFLLDRRAAIYRLEVDGVPAEVVRGSELGALGLDGFTPELESSFRFPRPLGEGEEALVTFRLRAPLVHLDFDGIVTTLPLGEGPFRVRAWMPTFDPAHAAGGAVEDVVMEGGWAVHWPADAFAETGFAPAEAVWNVERLEDEVLEEAGVRILYSPDAVTDPLRDLDFVLAPPGVSLAGLDWRARIAPPLPAPEFPLDRRAPGEPRLFRWASRAADGSAGRLDPHPRSRAALVRPLLDAADMSTRDMSSELSDLLPLDLDFLDEAFDAGDRDAEDGAGAQGER